MPLYPGVAGATVPVKSNLSPVSLTKGESVYVFGKLAATATQLPVNETNLAQETILAGQASIAVCLDALEPGSPPPMICVEVLFSGAPGTFELDVQEADTDADAFYILPTNAAYKINAVNATTQAARSDLSPTGGKFMRVLMLTLTNAVNGQVKLTRLA